MKQVETILGIIIRCDKHKEDGLRISLFTADGIKNFYAQGALKPTGKLKGALQLFNVVELTTVGTKITGAHLATSGFGLTKEINRFYLAGGISETLLALFKTYVSDEKIYMATVEAIILLSATNISCYKIYLRFYGGLLKAMGYDLHEESVVSEKIEQFVQASPDAIDNIPLTLAEAKRCVELLRSNFYDCLEVKIPSI